MPAVHGVRTGVAWRGAVLWCSAGAVLVLRWCSAGAQGPRLTPSRSSRKGNASTVQHHIHAIQHHTAPIQRNMAF